MLFIAKEVYLTFCINIFSGEVQCTKNLAVMKQTFMCCFLDLPAVLAEYVEGSCL